MKNASFREVKEFARLQMPEPSQKVNSVFWPDGLPKWYLIRRYILHTGYGRW